MAVKPLVEVDEATRHQAEKRQQHARGCKKSPSECKVCRDNMKWFGELPLPVLARVLED